MASSTVPRRPCPASAAVLAARAALGDEVVYVTNNAMHYHGDYVPRLAGHGAPVGPDRVVTSARASAAWIRQHMPGVRAVLSVGAGGLDRELLEAGFEVTTAAHAATRMSQEGLDGWEAAGPPGRRGRGPRPAAHLPADRRGGGLRSRGRRVRGHEPGPRLPDGARPASRCRRRGGRDRGRRPPGTRGDDRQARALPAGGGRGHGRRRPGARGDDRRRAHRRGRRTGRGGAHDPDADRDHQPRDRRRAPARRAAHAHRRRRRRAGAGAGASSPRADARAALGSTVGCRRPPPARRISAPSRTRRRRPADQREQQRGDHDGDPRHQHGDGRGPAR